MGQDQSEKISKIDPQRIRGLATEAFTWLVLASTLILVLLSLAACNVSPTATFTPSLRCPTPTPGEYMYQGVIRPPRPDYPNAENIEVATPIPPANSVETPTPNTWNSYYEFTTKITRFTTSDDAATVLSFYSRNLAMEGWIESNSTPSANQLTFGYSVESTVMAASRSNPCAPTVETGLPGHSVEVTIISRNGNSTTVEVKEVVAPGF